MSLAGSHSGVLPSSDFAEHDRRIAGEACIGKADCHQCVIRAGGSILVGALEALAAAIARSTCRRPHLLHRRSDGKRAS